MASVMTVLSSCIRGDDHGLRSLKSVGGSFPILIKGLAFMRETIASDSSQFPRLVHPAGLIHVGDELREVNGIPVEDKRPEEVIQILVRRRFVLKLQ